MVVEAERERVVPVALRKVRPPVLETLNRVVVEYAPAVLVEEPTEKSI